MEVDVFVHMDVDFFWLRIEEAFNSIITVPILKTCPQLCGAVMLLQGGLLFRFMGSPKTKAFLLPVWL